MDRQDINQKILLIINDGRDRCNVPEGSTQLSQAFWIPFLQRHPSMVNRVFQPLEKLRSEAAESGQLLHYSELLADHLMEYRAPDGTLLLRPSQFHNLDETGIDLTVDGKKCFARKGLKRTRVRVPDKNSHVSLLITISANGSFRRPLFIMKQAETATIPIIEDGPEGAVYATSSSGFITSAIFNRYMEQLSNNFLWERARRRTMPEEYPFPYVDIVFTDGHSSRFFLPTIERAALLNITLFKFPSHLSQEVQPLDLVFFKQFKKELPVAVTQWQRSHLGQAISATEIPNLVIVPLDKACSPHIIKSSFERSGIYPPNPEKIAAKAQRLLRAEDELWKILNGNKDGIVSLFKEKGLSLPKGEKDTIVNRLRILVPHLQEQGLLKYTEPAHIQKLLKI